jgi:hypothetical protein
MLKLGDYLEFQEIVASKERLKKLYEQRCKKNKNFFSCRKYNNSIKFANITFVKTKIQVIRHTTYIGEGK